LNGVGEGEMMLVSLLNVLLFGLGFDVALLLLFVTVLVLVVLW
jgi:hypothetical protein